MKKLTFFVLVIMFAVAACKKDKPISTIEVAYPHSDSMTGYYSYHYANNFPGDESFTDSAFVKKGYVIHTSKDSIIMAVYLAGNRGLENLWQGKLDSSGTYSYTTNGAYPTTTNIAVTKDTVIYLYNNPHEFINDSSSNGEVFFIKFNGKMISN